MKMVLAGAVVCAMTICGAAYSQDVCEPEIELIYPGCKTIEVTTGEQATPITCTCAGLTSKGSIDLKDKESATVNFLDATNTLTAKCELVNVGGKWKVRCSST